MGWWRIKDVESGAVDFDAKTAAKTANAVPGADDPVHAYGGDGPADVMEAALDKINALYREAWKRNATRDELRAVFNFCTGGKD